MSWEDFVCSVLMEVCLLCYRSSHSAFHLRIIFRIYGHQTSALAVEIDDRSTPVQGCKQYVTWFLGFSIVSHVNFYFLAAPLW